jgi:branched-chain amino acid transport system permease protein
VQLFLIYLVAGISSGSIYAIAASGLVVTYSTSRVFNFGHGAIGTFVAFFCYWLWATLGWPEWAAIGISVLLLAPAIGIGLDASIIRWLAGVPVAQKLAVTLALLLTFEGLTQLLWGAGNRTMPSILGNGGIQPMNGLHITYDELLTVAVAVCVAAGLWALLHRTRLGTTMRAVVEDRDLAELHSVNPRRVTALSWAIGTMLGGLAAILIAPDLTLSIANLSLFVVSAYAAAVVGRLTSLPVTFAAAVAIGIGSSLMVGYLPSSSQFIQSLSGGLPFIVLVLALIVFRHRGEALQRIRQARESPPLSLAATAGLTAGGVVLAFACAGFLGNFYSLMADVGLVFACVLLSLVLITGMAGQVSLAQFSFMGIGVVLVTHLSSVMPYWIALVLAVAATCAIGALVALPALRLSGVYLALLTLGFAILMDQVVFVNASVFGSVGGALNVPTPSLFGYQLNTAQRLLPLLALVAGGYGIVVLAIRRHRLGRNLGAMRDSPIAASALGLNIVGTKVTAFAVASAMAGLAGCLYGAVEQQAAAIQFNYLASLNALLILVLWGASNVPGAYLGALFYVVGFLELPRLVNNPSLVQAIQQLGVGLAVFGMARNPDGVVRQWVDQHRAKAAARAAGRADAAPVEAAQPAVSASSLGGRGR